MAKIKAGCEGLHFNTSTWEAEAGSSLSLRAAWSIDQVPGQPERNPVLPPPQREKESARERGNFLKVERSSTLYPQVFKPYTFLEKDSFYLCLIHQCFWLRDKGQ